MDINEKRRHNERLANRLKQLDDEIKAAKRRMEREECERLDREAHRMQGLIALREASLAEIVASVEPRRKTERMYYEEIRASSQEQEMSPDTPRPSTSREGERWETREVRWEHTFEEESTDEECPQWRVRSPSKTTIKLTWSEVYSSSSSRTPSAKKKKISKATETTRSRTDFKLEAKAVVKLNRLKEIDTSGNRHSNTGLKTKNNNEHQNPSPGRHTY
ncbi:uncharacterized abhydrolase domain-containing protein DDB_G0269086-like [Odontomachus brunneus]|uniref:uncharacterized abhydrolase domain-containing protein DDB_G0269086-like n=1 Tax=Odontomachus brunneus TaxID=486640 RepID=UPI0013F26416|nr:uncharacterized abhydrolase domain-containing protein DDB_G0269086-like [Odontomachus brunneus]